MLISHLGDLPLRERRGRWRVLFVLRLVEHDRVGAYTDRRDRDDRGSLDAVGTLRCVVAVVAPVSRDATYDFRFAVPLLVRRVIIFFSNGTTAIDHVASKVSPVGVACSAW